LARNVLLAGLLAVAVVRIVRLTRRPATATASVPAAAPDPALLAARVP
jgi:hypothetical protein